MEAIYVIKKPLLTEKSTIAMNERNQYTFEVDRSATKTDIKRAVEALYGVRVESVQTITQRGRSRRLRYGWVKGPQWKKAVVRLHDEDRIELF